MSWYIFFPPIAHQKTPSLCQISELIVTHQSKRLPTSLYTNTQQNSDMLYCVAVCLSGIFLQSASWWAKSLQRSPTRWTSGQWEWSSSSVSTDGRCSALWKLSRGWPELMNAGEEKSPEDCSAVVLWHVLGFYFVFPAVWSQPVAAGYSPGEHHPQSHWGPVPCQTPGQHRGQGNTHKQIHLVVVD